MTDRYGRRRRRKVIGGVRDGERPGARRCRDVLITWIRSDVRRHKAPSDRPRRCFSPSRRDAGQVPGRRSTCWPASTSDERCPRRRSSARSPGQRRRRRHSDHRDRAGRHARRRASTVVASSSRADGGKDDQRSGPSPAARTVRNRQYLREHRKRERRDSNPRPRRDRPSGVLP